MVNSRPWTNPTGMVISSAPIPTSTTRPAGRTARDPLAMAGGAPEQSM